jgi:hypothetical protein
VEREPRYPSDLTDAQWELVEVMLPLPKWMGQPETRCGTFPAMSGFPFVYLNHGPLDPDSFHKVDAAWIAFAEPLSDEVLAALVDTCPAPLDGFLHADDAIFYCETLGDVYDIMVREEYGADGYDVSAEGAAAFSADVEAWVRGIHEQVPIAFVIGPGRPLEDDNGAIGAWALWSEQQLVPVVIPWLERYADTHPDLPEQSEETDAIVQRMDQHTLSFLRQHFLEDDPHVTRRLDALGSRLGWE